MAKATQRMPKAISESSTFRVWKLGQHVRDAMQVKRSARNQTVREYVEAAICDELGPLVESLQAVGISGPIASASPMRVPVSDRVLADLRRASQQSGLDQCQLVEACLRNATSRKRRRKRKSQKP